MADPGQTAAYEDAAAGGVLVRRIGLFAGFGAFAGMIASAPPAGLEPVAWKALALLALMIIWWVTEAIPVAATAMLPLVGLPVMGIAKPVDAAAPYADPIIFLFIGGFMIAVAIERSGLHRRIALGVLKLTGTSPPAIVGGFMLATALLSMWISNTATALMMTPIALAVCSAAMPEGPDRRKLTAATVLAVAWAASIGGIGTPVGSPTNLIANRWLEGAGVGLSFPQWMAIGCSVIVVLLPLGWLLLTRAFYPLAAHGRDSQAASVIAAERKALGPMRQPEVRVLIVFLAVALAWMFRMPLSELPGLGGLTDMGIAIVGAVVLFVLPKGDKAAPGTALLDWEAAERIPWGIAILFGGGLSMAAAMEAAGVSAWIGEGLSGIGVLPVVGIILVLVAATVFASELASNVATLTAMLPVLTALVAATGTDPLIIGAAAGFAASFGFMLPVATAANAIAYATGAPTQSEMLRSGLIMNLLGIAAIATAVAVIAPLVTS
jgi:solute carrier family 13 (sodium-dependent dicarboxylate transporter), member 2/3/5